MQPESALRGDNRCPLLESRLRPRNHHSRSFYHIGHCVDQIWPQRHHRRGAHARLGCEGPPRRRCLRRTRPLRIPCVYGRLLRVLNWVHRHGVHRGYRLRLERRRTRCESCPGVDRAPGTTHRDARTHWRRYKIYCTLLLSRVASQRRLHVRPGLLCSYSQSKVFCRRLKGAIANSELCVRSLNSCASIFAAICLATVDSSVLPISTQVTSGSVQRRTAGW
jgi:hypothetical protein